jgi:hypothetical protein
MAGLLMGCGEDTGGVNGPGGPDKSQDTANRADDAISLSDTTAQDKCASHDECAHVSSNTGCAAGRCNNGKCTSVHAPKGKICQVPGQLVGSCQDSQCNGFGACKVVALADGSGCADEKCGDKCSNGQCQKKPPADDGNPCTVEFCKNGTDGVQKLTDPNTKCADGDPCTHEDSCVQGQCKGKTQPCDDGVPCTIDWCDPDKGCQILPADGLCSDNNPCVVSGCDSTKGCVAKSFKKGQPCSDGNPCTSGDACNSIGECVATTNNCKCKSKADCKSDNLCKPLMCQGNGCVIDEASETKCPADGDSFCSANLCNPATGKCVLKPLKESKDCDDSDPCTSKSVCGGGSCQGQAQVACDDGNGCTKDSCTKGKGCVFVVSGASCDDGNLCTIEDKCQGAGTCSGAFKSCNDNDPCTNDACNKKTGACEHTKKPDCNGCKTAKDCEDGNECTQDICEDNGKCANLSQPNCTKKCTSAAECNDKDACTLDGCNDGKCLHKPKPGCVPQCKDHKDCDDGVACTVDTCAKNAGSGGATSATCKHTPTPDCKQCKANSNCDDGDKCTTDTCDAKTQFCQYAQIPNCGTTSGCKTKADCDDKNKCTNDQCLLLGGGPGGAGLGICSNSKIPNCTAGCKADKDCDDSITCTVDKCQLKPGDAAGTCTNVKNANCQCGNANDCDDKNKCTTDACTNNKCSNTKVAGCNDGSCKAVKDCEDSNPCTQDLCTNGKCEFKQLVCKDQNGCTYDSCNTKSGACEFKPIPNCNKQCSSTTQCQTGSKCVYQYCQNGTCKAYNQKNCNDNNACTFDSCNHDTGQCKFEKIAGCENGKCTKPADCDDKNDCTTDYCNTFSGKCTHYKVPNCVIGKACASPADCNDKNGCTSDLCAQKKCISVPISCDDGNPCTNDGCQNFSGACYHSKIAGCVAVKCSAPADCNDLNKCTDDTCNGGYCKNNFIPGCK